MVIGIVIILIVSAANAIVIVLVIVTEIMILIVNLNINTKRVRILNRSDNCKTGFYSDRDSISNSKRTSASINKRNRNCLNNACVKGPL